MNPESNFLWSAASIDPNDMPMGSLVGTDERSRIECDAQIFGIPFDGAVLGRKGAAGGPNAIRTAFQKLKAPDDAAQIFDWGDVALKSQDISNAHEAVEDFLGDARRYQRKRIVALGGDHSLTYPCAIRLLRDYGDDLTVINLDAHLDVRETPLGQSPNSGTSFGRLIDNGLKSYIVVGARKYQTSPHYWRRAIDAGAQIISASNVHARGAGAVACDVVAMIPQNCRAIYLSVDLDVADASVAPGVSAPTPGGLLAHQIFEIVRIICENPRVVACDIMECAPNLEEPNSNRTARLGAGCLAEMIASV